MTYLVRKITRTKWEPTEALAADEIPADAVTVDLRTTSNTLSFWMLDMPSNDAEIRSIVLALVTGAERIDRMDVTWIARDTLDAQNISLAPSDGRTPVESLRSKHVDATKIDLIRLCGVATQIAEALRLSQYRRYTKKELVQIIVEAIRDKRVSIDDLAPKVREEVEKKLVD